MKASPKICIIVWTCQRCQKVEVTRVEAEVYDEIWVVPPTGWDYFRIESNMLFLCLDCRCNECEKEVARALEHPIQGESNDVE